MSLFNQVADSLAKQSANSNIMDGMNAITGGAGSAIKQVFGGGPLGDAAANIGTSMARNAALSVYNGAVSPRAQLGVNVGVNALGNIMNGNIGGAVLGVLDSGLLNSYLPGMSGVAAQAMYWGSPTPLLGGISPAEARQIYEDMRMNEFCRKNLWLIEVHSTLGNDESFRFNLFATEVEYDQYTLTGEKIKVGGATIDTVTSSEPVELRLTTVDNIYGSLRNWFGAHCVAEVAQDGTVGLPGNYAIKIKIVHGFITHDSNPGGYEDIGWFRAGGVNYSLSRREDALQEIQFSFIQLDTFLK